MLSKNNGLVNTIQTGISLSLPARANIKIQHPAPKESPKATLQGKIFTEKSSPPKNLFHKFNGVKIFSGQTVNFIIGCGAWIRTKIPCSRGMCPTIRRPRKIKLNFKSSSS